MAANEFRSYNFAVSTNATKIVVGVKWQGMCFYKRMEKALEGYNLEEQRFDELVYGKEIAMSDSGDVTAYESREPYTATVGFPSEPHQGNDTTVVLNGAFHSIYSMELSGDGSVLAVLAPIKVADNYLYSYKYDHNTSTVALYTFRRDAESFNNEWKPMTDTATLFHKLDAMFPGIYAPNDPLAVSFDGKRLAMAWLVEAERTENSCDEREFRVMVMDYNETSRAWKIVAEKTSVESNNRNYAYA